MYARQLLETTKSRLEFALSQAQVSAQSLASLVYNDNVTDDFDSVAKILLAGNHDIDAAALIPDGVISYIYPLKGNESAIGYNIFSDTIQRKEREESIKKRQFYFAGPLRLRQGGKGIVGRLPVFVKQKFWGFSAVIIRLETLVKLSGIESIDDSKYYFQFSKIDPTTHKEEFFFKVKEDFSRKCFQTVIIPEGDWNQAFRIEVKKISPTTLYFKFMDSTSSSNEVVKNV